VSSGLVREITSIPTPLDVAAAAGVSAAESSCSVAGPMVVGASVLLREGMMAMGNCSGRREERIRCSNRADASTRQGKECVDKACAGRSRARRVSS